MRNHPRFLPPARPRLSASRRARAFWPLVARAHRPFKKIVESCARSFEPIASKPRARLLDLCGRALACVCAFARACACGLSRRLLATDEHARRSDEQSGGDDGERLHTGGGSGGGDVDHDGRRDASAACVLGVRARARVAAAAAAAWALDRRTRAIVGCDQLRCGECEILRARAARVFHFLMLLPAVDRRLVMVLTRLDLVARATWLLASSGAPTSSRLIVVQKAHSALACRRRFLLRGAVSGARQVEESGERKKSRLAGRAAAATAADDAAAQ